MIPHGEKKWRREHPRCYHAKDDSTTEEDQAEDIDENVPVDTANTTKEEKAPATNITTDATSVEEATKEGNIPDINNPKMIPK